MDNGKVQTQTVELTAKKWKLIQLIGMAVFAVFGVLTLVTADHPFMGWPCAALTVGGAGVYVAGRVMAWWHHG